MRMIKSIMAGFLISLVTGCVTPAQETANSTPTRSSVGSSHQSETIEVVLSGDRLSKDLAISNQSVNVVGTLKRAGFTLSNRSRNLYHLEYKIDWMDQYGRQVSNGIWQRFQLLPNMRRDITSVSKTQDAEKLLATIRLPDDETLKGKHLKDSFISK